MWNGWMFACVYILCIEEQRHTLFSSMCAEWMWTVCGHQHTPHSYLYEYVGATGHRAKLCWMIVGNGMCGWMWAWEDDRCCWMKCKYIKIHHLSSMCLVWKKARADTLFCLFSSSSLAITSNLKYQRSKEAKWGSPADITSHPNKHAAGAYELPMHLQNYGDYSKACRWNSVSTGFHEVA